MNNFLSNSRGTKTNPHSHTPKCNSTIFIAVRPIQLNVQLNPVKPFSLNHSSNPSLPADRLAKQISLVRTQPKNVLLSVWPLIDVWGKREREEPGLRTR